LKPSEASYDVLDVTKIKDQAFNKEEGAQVAPMSAKPLLSVPGLPTRLGPGSGFKIKYTVHSKVFDLSDDKQLEEFNEVYKQVPLGDVIISEEDRQFHDGKFIVYLRWADVEIVKEETEIDSK